MHNHISEIEFNELAKDLPFLLDLYYDVEILYIERIDSSYFCSNKRQRCIVKRANGAMFVAWYD